MANGVTSENTNVGSLFDDRREASISELNNLFDRKYKAYNTRTNPVLARPWNKGSYDSRLTEEEAMAGYRAEGHSTGHSKTWTKLYFRLPEFLMDAWQLYDVESKMIRAMCIKDLTIPVSPSELNYKRESQHNEVYCIESGGMLQRNLPGLWRVSINSYIPHLLADRFFHNRQVSYTHSKYEKYIREKNDWTGMSIPSTPYRGDGINAPGVGSGGESLFQQYFIDTINDLMRYKLPFEMWDDSFPKRIKHAPKYWCIEHFDYKMLPHDDIDYTLELVEWKEPIVTVRDTKIIEETPETPEEPKKVPGSGVSLLAFGWMDNRAFDGGRVYNPQLRAFVAVGSRTYYGLRNKSDLQSILSSSANFTDIFAKYAKRVGAKVGATSATVASSHLTMSGNTVSAGLVVRLHTQSGTSIDLNIMTSRIEPMASSMINDVVYDAINASKKAITSSASIHIQKETSAPGANNGKSAFWHDCWCKKVKQLAVPTLRHKLISKPTVKINRDASSSDTWTVAFTWESHFVEEQEEKYSTMYIIQPKSGSQDDKLYDHKQTIMTPKQNTIKAPYQQYLNSMQTVYSKKQKPNEEPFKYNMDGEKPASEKTGKKK